MKMKDYPILKIFEQNKNDEAAPKMAAYMKNKFEFLGINAPTRKYFQKEFIREKSKSKSIDWDFVFTCFDMPQREFQYLAIDYLILMKKWVQKVDIEKLETLIQTKSWWDSVDGLDEIVGTLAQKYPELVDSHIRKWMVNSNIWLVRVSINFQLQFKSKTDVKLLSEAIVANFGSKEFFINKAIGWSLREYAKTDKVWVIDFLENHQKQLHSLSIREAKKHF